jgi:hypothetical protein
MLLAAWWLLVLRRRRPALVPDFEATRALLSERAIRRARMRTGGDPVIASIGLDEASADAGERGDQEQRA